MPALPSSLALTTIAPGAQLLSADHRTNYAAIQAAMNALISAVGVTAKGDLLVATANGTIINVPVGANGLALVADSAQSAGVKWGTVAGYLAAPQKYSTLIDVVSSTTETHILQASGYSIPAGLLGADGTARVTFWGDFKNITGSNQSCSFKVKLGATTLYDSGAGNMTIASSANRRGFRLVLELTNLTASSQMLVGMFGLTPTDAVTTGLGFIADAAGATANIIGTSFYAAAPIQGTSAEDTTAAKTLAVTWTHGTNSANLELRVYKSLIEFI